MSLPATLVGDVLKMTDEDLRQLNRLVVDTIKSKQKQAAWKFSTGDKITWVGKYGKQSGKITKVNRLNLKVTADDGRRWIVAASLAQKVA